MQGKKKASAAAAVPKKVLPSRGKMEVEIFTVDQKKLLTDKINSLSPEDLQRMVDLISGELPENARQNGELEIDLESLKIPTLKKLDLFVDSCLKQSGAAVPSKDTKSGSPFSDSDSSSDSDSDSENEKEKEAKPNVATI